VTRPVHYATDTLTACGLSLSFSTVLRGKKVSVGPCNGNRVRHGDPRSSPLVVHVTCKNCLRAMRK
jgi:hypothetical protein